MEIRIAQHFSDSMYSVPWHMEVDGREYGGIDVTHYEVTREPRSIWTFHVRAVNAAAAHSLSQLPLAAFPSDVGKVQLPVDFQWRDFSAIALLDWIETPARLIFEFRPDLRDWTGPLSFATVTHTIQVIHEERGGADFIEMTSADDGAFRFHLLLKGATIAAAIGRHLDNLTFYRDEVERRLRNMHDGLMISFRFPEDVRVACEQYLLYFAEFLSDIGVQARTSIRNETDHVLFSVIPDDSRHALSAIQEALELYLSLPGAPLAESEASEVESLKLLGNIHHLKSQLMLAKALIQTQETTIDAQRFALEAQRNFMNANVVTPRAESDREVLFGGTVALTRYEGKGFEISIAEVFRRLRARFRL